LRTLKKLNFFKKLNLRVSDGTARTVDFGNFLCSSLNLMIKKYLDTEKFRKFTVEYGDLVP